MKASGKVTSSDKRRALQERARQKAERLEAKRKKPRKSKAAAEPAAIPVTRTKSRRHSRLIEHSCEHLYEIQGQRNGEWYGLYQYRHRGQAKAVFAHILDVSDDIRELAEFDDFRLVPPTVETIW